MDKFIKELENVETNAFNCIIQMFNTHNITELDVSNKNEDFEDLEVFVIGEDCNLNRIKINNIILKNNCLKFIDDNGNKYEQFELIEGSMPYIYRNVKYYIENSVKIFVPYYGEFIDIKLNPEKYPIAYKNKVNELIKDGLSKEDAEDYVNNTVFTLELIYEECQGLFAVEPEAIESGEIISPFTSKIIEVENEN